MKIKETIYYPDVTIGPCKTLAESICDALRFKDNTPSRSTTGTESLSIRCHRNK